MHVGRGGEPQQMLQINLARRGSQQVGTAHDMRDALKRIVDYYRQLIGKQTIRTLYYEIADFAFEVLRKVPLQCIVELNRGRGKGKEGRVEVGAYPPCLLFCPLSLWEIADLPA